MWEAQEGQLLELSTIALQRLADLECSGLELVCWECKTLCSQ